MRLRSANTLLINYTLLEYLIFFSIYVVFISEQNSFLSEYRNFKG